MENQRCERRRKWELACFRVLALLHVPEAMLHEQESFSLSDVFRLEGLELSTDGEVDRLAAVDSTLA